MGVREQQKATNRQSIAQAALETFIEIGYEACTIRDIVRYSGLSPGTFYNYFESKEDVLDFILQDLAIRVRQTVRRERARATSGRDFIYQGFFAFLEEVGREPAILRMLSRNQTFLGIWYLEMPARSRLRQILWSPSGELIPPSRRIPGQPPRFRGFSKTWEKT
ncbi:MAG: TetR/AcrR family transcriptional regulator [Leptospiraceae bacterium]|nr:TetR/AcrR family transcriptional regulator [Leptospiraceae bacterium]